MTEENITTAYENGNYKDYTSYVHSLKSTSRTIGAKELSKLAEKMEAAGNANDIDTINEYQSELMNMYSLVRYTLSKVPEIAGEKSDDEEIKKDEISKKELIDAYQSIAEVSRTLDYDTLTFILDSLKKYSLPERDERTIRKIGDLAYKLQWDEIINLAQEGLKAQE
jgi:HPt (histidine-containing phosphotransfer) domain-containing protein